MTEDEKYRHKAIGLYIHIPFCRSKCPYCDFCTFPHPRAEQMEDYVAELCRRMRRDKETYADVGINSVYLGGGTPSLLPIAALHRLMLEVKDSFDILPDAEITLECNPATVDRKSLAQWWDMGVNRISMGAQSAQPSELKALGRLHTWSDVCRTVEDARAVGIENINLDFMMGIPHQTAESLTDTLEKAISLAPHHLSSYCLSLEEGTPFHRRGAESLGLPDDDAVAEMYLRAAEIIKGAGYEHYEISNFCRKGFESRHNLNTWQAGEYLGYGVAAHSHVGLTRFGNSRDIDAFLRGEDIVTDKYDMTPAEAAAEAVILGLRLSQGVELDRISQKFGLPLPTLADSRLRGYKDGGLVYIEGSRLALTEAGWLVSNQILSYIWEILEEIWENPR